MGVKFLQELVDNDGVIPNSVVPVDLIKLAKNYVQSILPQQRKPGVSPKFSLVVDGESCLNRLYGGFYAGKEHMLLVEWVCEVCLTRHVCRLGVRWTMEPYG